MVGVSFQALLTASGSKGITARFVNEYALSFASTTTATATVPAVDLVLPASATKQILVFVGEKVPVISQVTVNAVRAGWICTGAQFFVACSAVYAGSGPFNIVVTVTAASTENGGVMVYEIDNAAPLYESTRGIRIAQQSANMRQLTGAVIIGGGYFGTDSTAFTWSGLTENFDADVGDYRLSSAVDLTPAGSRTSRTLSVNPPTTPHIYNIGVLPSGFTGQVRGGFQSLSSATGSGSTFTFSLAQVTNYNNIGNVELVMGVTTEANVTLTGATFNAVAMTSRGSVVNTGPAPDLIVHFFSIALTAGSASGNIVITASASVAGILCQIGLWTLYGVASYGTLVSNQGNPGTGATTSPVVNAGGAALFACITATSTGITVTGADSIVDNSVGTFETAFANIVNDAAATESIISSFSSQAFAQAALPVNP